MIHDATPLVLKLDDLVSEFRNKLTPGEVIVALSYIMGRVAFEGNVAREDIAADITPVIVSAFDEHMKSLIETSMH